MEVSIINYVRLPTTVSTKLHIPYDLWLTLAAMKTKAEQMKKNVGVM